LAFLFFIFEKSEAFVKIFGHFHFFCFRPALPAILSYLSGGMGIIDIP